MQSEILGSKNDFSQQYDGYVKCKLMHSRGVSIIVPDQLYLRNVVGDGAILWYQPRNFFACTLGWDENEISCGFRIDLDDGYSVDVLFSDRDYIRSFSDGSEFYRCRMNGPKQMPDIASGIARVLEDHSVQLRLFHHTTQAAKTAIADSRQFRGSHWNIQGTSKHLVNVNYAYLTHLKDLRSESDLERIAMSGTRRLWFTVDNAPVPNVLAEDDALLYAPYVLPMEVYHGRLSNLSKKLLFWVPAELLAPQHLFMHSPIDPPWYYEVCCPCIHRIGLAPGGWATLHADGALTVDPGREKNLGYLVAGDATTLDGLRAPFDEENTTYVFKIEDTTADGNMLRFWKNHSNTDLYSGKAVEMQQFRPA